MMRRAMSVIAVLAGIGLIAVVATEWVRPVQGQVAGVGRLPAGMQDGGELVVMTHSTETGERIVLVDKSSRVMAVYEVGASGGRIQLKSVRNFRWDMLMEVFNETDPKPKDIRAQVEK